MFGFQVFSIQIVTVVMITVVDNCARFFSVEKQLSFFAALVIGIYDDSIQPGQAAIVVEKMADYLSDNNC